MYYWCEQRKHKYYGGVWAGQTSKKTITCQHFKDCINTGYLNQCESSGLTGSVFLFKLGSLSRHMKKLHWFLSVSELWQGAVNAAGLQVTDCVRWRIVFAQILCSAFKLQNRGDLSEQESTCTPIFHWRGRRSTVASRCLIHPQAPSWIKNGALSCKCSGKTRAEIQLCSLSLPTEALHLCSAFICAQWIFERV